MALAFLLLNDPCFLYDLVNCSNAGDYLNSPSVKASGVHRMHEVWSRPCSKVCCVFSFLPEDLLITYSNSNIYTDAFESMNRGVRYHEPEHWKFGDEGNKYFRHATGQLYAISKDLATYISINK